MKITSRLTIILLTFFCNNHLFSQEKKIKTASTKDLIAIKIIDAKKIPFEIKYRIEYNEFSQNKFKSIKAIISKYAKDDNWIIFILSQELSYEDKIKLLNIVKSTQYEKVKMAKHSIEEIKKIHIYLIKQKGKYKVKVGNAPFQSYPKKPPLTDLAPNIYRMGPAPSK